MKKLVAFLLVITVFYSCQTAGDYVNQGKYTFNLVQGNYYKEYANVTPILVPV